MATWRRVLLQFRLLQDGDGEKMNTAREIENREGENGEDDVRG